MSAAQNSDPRLNNLRPFPKGKSGNPGGLSKSVRKFRREAEKRLPRALELLDEMMKTEADAEDKRFAMEWLRKCFVPTPKDTPSNRPNATGGTTLPDALRSKLARIQ